MTGMLFLAWNCCTSDVWLGALSWCRNHSPCHLSRRFLRTASHKHSCHHSTTVLSGSRSEWLLTLPYSENGQEDAFRNYWGHQIECDGRTPEDSKRSLRPVLPTVTGSMEQVCVRARVLIWRWFGVVICPTITVLYHISGNFMTAPRRLLHIKNVTSTDYVMLCDTVQLCISYQ